MRTSPPRSLRWLLLLAAFFVLSGCLADAELEQQQAGFCSWSRTGATPEVVDPEIVVSLGGLTLHLFDRETGQDFVYPVGVGRKRANGTSLTPTGHFQTGSVPGVPWFYTCRSDAHFGGWPFIRLTRGGSHTPYGMHGPITSTLQRGYVSKGCVRMEGQNVAEMYEILDGHLETPVTIQTAVELDAAGNPVEVGQPVASWGPDDPRPEDLLDLADADEYADDPEAEWDDGEQDPFDEGMFADRGDDETPDA